MVILEMFGKIDEIIISEKLGIVIKNLDEDWKNDMPYDFIEELKIREVEADRYSDFSVPVKNYDLEEILSDRYYDGIFQVVDSQQENLSELASKLISIQIVDYDNTYLNYNNSMICNPTCEKEFEEKLIKFLHFIISHNFERDSKMKIPYWMYSSEHDFFQKPKMILGVDRTRNKRGLFRNHNVDLYNYIESLKYFGERIDNYLENENDFYKLDYLINSIYENESYNAIHLFKMISLIEMLLIDSKSKGLQSGNFHIKLAPFLTEDKFKNDAEKKEFSDIIRVIRNKIAHGNFLATKKKLEEFAQKFMKNYWFDYIEYSRENWIYLNLCCILNEIVSKIIWLELSDKKKMERIKSS